MNKSKKGGKCMSEGGRVGNKGEKHYKMGGTDPRTGPERLAGVINRVASGNRNSPVRKYDDDAATRAKNVRASKEGKASRNDNKASRNKK